MGRGESPPSAYLTPLRAGQSVWERAQIQLPAKLFHCCPRESRSKIFTEGLIGGASEGLTRSGVWADSVYGTRPVFLSVRPWPVPQAQRAEWELLQVDSTRLSSRALRVDIPSLIDHGMCVEEGGVYWEEGSAVGDEIHQAVGDEIPIEQLTHSPELTRKSFELTQSLAHLGRIEPSAITPAQWPAP